MSTESIPKPRFVLCPKCWQLLQEAPNLDLYKCGGCGTTLQAKKRKSKAANSESSSNETDAAPGNASDLSPQENVLREKATSCSSADCSSERNEGRDQIENGECNGENLVTTRENGLRETNFSSSGECSSEGNTERGQIENGNYNEEPPVISPENGLREKETSPSSGECSSDGNSERGQIENGECDEERIGPLNLSDEEPENAMDINKLSDIRRHTASNKGFSNELPQCDIEASAESMTDNSVEKVNVTNLKLEEEQSNGSMPLEGAGNRLVSTLEREDASDEISDLIEVKSEADIGESDLEVAGEFNNGTSSQGADQKLIFGSDEQCVDNEKFALVDESLAKDVDETDMEDSKELQRTEVDTGGNAFTAKKLSTEYIESEKISILCVSPRELKVGTSDNHASSPENIRHSFDHVMSANTFDDTEVNNLSLKSSGSLGQFTKSPTTKSSHAYDGSVSSNDGTDERSLGQNLYSFEGGSRKGKSVVVNSMVYEDVQTQYQNEVLGTTRHDHAHQMRTRKDEFPFKMPLHGNFSQSGYESGSPSNQIYDELYLSSSYVSPDSVEDPDQEKMKLLRMVYKLQDQLNRTRETYERPSVVSRNSSLQSHDFHEGRFYHGLDYPSEDANSSYNHGISMHQRRHNFSGIPPGNAHYVDHPSFNCYPQEQQRFGNFPPHFPYQREDLYRPHPAHSRVLSQHSYPSSPQRLLTRHVHGRETKSCDQRYRAPEMNYTREKPNVTKRHYRPVAGGAPFITCLKCLNLLQLPADFLLFKRVCHKLKCGACQEVLKFSMQNRTHIVSYAPNTVDPVSYSDDYGRSVSKSHSSEGDPVSVAPFHHSHSGARGNPRVSPTTVEAITGNEKEKIIASRGPSTSKTTSSESSEIEESQSQPKASALHQLMGYSSPSLVIRGASTSAEGKKAMLSGEY